MPGSESHPCVDVIVVNYNAGEALQRCIRSVLEQRPTNSLTVIDNVSADGSASQASELFAGEQRFRLIRNANNPGFAAAVNRVADEMSVGQAGDYLLILNPDCELQPGSLGALVQSLEDEPAAALAGPLVTDPAGRPQRANLRRFPAPWSSFVSFSGLWRLEPWLPVFRGVEPAGPLPRETTSCEAVSGACMLVRKSAFLAAGGLDAAYRLHCEDLDLMYRLHEAGNQCLFVPQARAVHVQGLSSRSRPLWVHWQKHRGMQRFFMKFQADSYPLLLRWPIRLVVWVGIWTRFAITAPLALLRH